MTEKYALAARVMHWLIAVCVIALVLAGLVLNWHLAPKSAEPIVDFLHFGFGLTMLALMLARLAVRLANPPPALPAAIPLNEQRLATAGHWGFYALLFAMPVFGVLLVQAHGHPVSWFGLFTLPQFIATSKPVGHVFSFLHFWGGMSLIALFFAHIGALFWHRRRGIAVLQRMWP